MKLGPKYKIAKRLGASVFEKTQGQKFALALERGAVKKRGRAPSEFGKQLLEKQKMRISYGLTEKQFGNYVKKAMSARGTNPATALHESLEMRLDNLVYRLGLAKTRRFARQMVSHGHITVNGVKTTIPSQKIYLGDKIAIREGSKKSTMFEGFEARFRETPLASYLSWNPKEMAGEVKVLPTTESASVAGDIAMVLSFYSR